MKRSIKTNTKIEIVEQKHSESLDNNKIRLITFLGFLFGFSVAIIGYLSAIYFREVLGTDNVGFLYTISFIIILIVLLNLHKILMRIGRGRTLMITLTLQILVIFALILADTSLFGVILMMIYYILYAVVWVMFDIVLEAYSTDGETGRIRGLFLSVMGLGILCAPLYATNVLDKFGFSALFLTSLILYMIMFVIVLTTLNHIRGHVKRRHIPIIETIRKVAKRTELRNIYLVSLVLRYFFATMTIFMPLYLIDLGFSLPQIGWMFTIMLLPFILFEYPVGILADKKFGEKGILIIGLIVMALASLLIVMTDSTSFYVWTAILFFSRVGAALVEPMQDAYFYRQIDGSNVALINFFRSSRAIAYIVSTGVATVVTYFFGLEAVFVMMLIVIIIGIYPAVTLKDSRISR